MPRPRPTGTSLADADRPGAPPRATGAVRTVDVSDATVGQPVANAIADATFFEVDEALLVLDENGTVLAANSSARNLLATTSEELTTWRLPHEPTAGTESDLRIDVAGRGPMRVQTRTVATRWNGRPAYLVAMAALSTHLQTVLEGGDAMARREAAERFPAQLLNLAAHELRTPLTPLLLDLERLERQAAPLLPAPLQGSLARLRRQADRFAATVTGIHDAARLLQPLSETDQKRFDLASEILDVCRFYERRAQARKQNLVVDVPSGLWLTGDAARLRDAVEQIVDNAVKFTPSGRTVSVRAFRDATSIVVEVEDDGLGIPRSLAAEVGRPFGPHGAGPRHPKAGAGLGLYLARLAIEAHGGTLDVRSEGVAKGTLVTLRLPT